MTVRFLGHVCVADVDGTLIESVGPDANKLHKEAFAQAFKQVYGIDTHIDVVQHHGATDPLVLLKVLVEAHGVAKADVMAKLNDAKACMIAHYETHKDRRELLLSCKGAGVQPGCQQSVGSVAHSHSCVMLPAA